MSLDIVSYLMGKSGGGGGDVLPAGYTKAAYIESDGTQYIDTGVPVTGDVEIDIAFSFNEVPSGWLGVVGGGDGNANNAFALLANTDHYSFQHNATYNDVSFVWEQNKQYHFDLIHGYFIDNAIVPFVQFSAQNQTIWIFKIPWAASAVKAKCYKCDIRSGNTLLRHFVPATRDSDGTAGMYDMATSTFFALT